MTTAEAAWYLTHGRGDVYLVREEERPAARNKQRKKATTYFKLDSDQPQARRFCHFLKCDGKNRRRCDDDLISELDDNRTAAIDYDKLKAIRGGGRQSAKKKECFSIRVDREALLAEVEQAAAAQKRLLQQQQGRRTKRLGDPSNSSWLLDPNPGGQRRRLFRREKGRGGGVHVYDDRRRPGSGFFCYVRQYQEPLLPPGVRPLEFDTDIFAANRGGGEEACFSVPSATAAAPPTTTTPPLPAAPAQPTVRPRRAPELPRTGWRGAELARLTLVRLASRTDYERLKPTAVRLAVTSTKPDVVVRDHLRFVADNGARGLLVLVSRSLRDCAMYGAWVRQTVQRATGSGTEQAIALAGGQVALPLMDCLLQRR